MENRIPSNPRPDAYLSGRFNVYLVVAMIAAAIYVGCMVSPPSLMDDVDSVQAQIARTMLASGDWVTARIDGVAYLEKSPLNYGTIAASFRAFGIHDWAARIPNVVSTVALSLLTCAFGIWAFGRRAGFYAGLCISPRVGLFLFTRISIPDVSLALCVTWAMWAFLRGLEPEEKRPRAWAAVMAASIGTGLILKSMVAVIFPVAAAVIYLAVTRQLFSREVWKRLRPFSGLAIGVLIAAPWIVLATLRNPPTFAWAMHSGPGEYHGFLWFYFVNEQVLRFLNMRYPRDYATVPRFYFWALHLVWLFPWSVYFPAIAAGGDWIRWGTRVVAAVSGCAALACAALLLMVRSVPTPGDISTALVTHPKAYSLSMGHIGDLTVASFAYLRLPLAVAMVAFLIGALGNFRAVGQRAFLAAGLMMVIFFHAARLALVDFDPFMSSRPLAEALVSSPDGQLIVNGQYYFFSSVVFYTNKNALLLNGRINNLVYGSYAPGAPDVFIGDAQFKTLWGGSGREYIVSANSKVPELEELVGASQMILVADSGGKSLFTNLPLAVPAPK